MIRRLWLKIRMRWALADMAQREFLFARPGYVLGHLLYVADIKKELER